MKSTIAPLLFAAAIGTAALAPAPASAATEPAGHAYIDPQVLAAGAGAIAGAVAFNVLSAPFGAVPLAGGALQVVPYTAALGSRLIAVVSAGVGALAANWLYDQASGQHTDNLELVSLGAGALVGVAAGNYMAMGMFGAPPYYVGAGVAGAGGELASSAAQAASRVYVIGSGVLGAWVADWLYHH